MVTTGTGKRKENSNGQIGDVVREVIQTLLLCQSEYLECVLPVLSWFSKSSNSADSNSGVSL